MTDRTPMQLEKYYTKEMAYTLQLRFCKVGYRPVSAQCLNSTQDNTIVMIIGPGVHIHTVESR